jgi:hypothetical protein
MAPKKIKGMLNSERYFAGQITRYLHSKKWGILLAPGWGILMDLGGEYS